MTSIAPTHHDNVSNPHILYQLDSAFANARSLGKGALPVLVRTLSLRQGVRTSPSTLTALCTAIKQVCGASQCGG